MWSTLWLWVLLALQPLSVSTYPSVSQAPADVRVTVAIAKDPLNEWLCIQWDGGDAGTSCMDLIGDREPVTRQLWLKHLSPGEYELTATLQRHDGHRFIQRTQFTVQ